MTPILEAKNVSKNYGVYQALKNVSLKFFEGETISIVGPNGAGKTTFVNVLTGLLKPTEGDVDFYGKSIAGVGPVKLSQYGMARAFQLVQIFPLMTVQETIISAVISQTGSQYNFWSSAAAQKPLVDKAYEVAKIFNLDKKMSWQASYLSQGEKKLLDIASAFALDPKVILLDEPTSGISTADKRGIMDTLMEAAKISGIKTILLVEHDMELVAEYSTRIVALAEGQLLADLPPKEFFANAELEAQIIGKRVSHA
ncbi:ATP-binding cassette domain-containing protein [Polynucleobacter sp. AP-Sanab-80-C2]|uniref:ABC transporter ATP-binding protein n=1 Tax=Polynucleobacter sp. AP-Sanab-80-C2 TaxID=3108274 RepID=UPI002B22B570|nr:ATP-binding cassette domain-containing protein [Polynucleobacter sp. AP-Sanab-80-C2]MEA9600462.1 ATP-binding cassette domain-containing protein [Polynucleobacter sp. AP-Sanab-80-C2]